MRGKPGGLMLLAELLAELSAGEWAAVITAICTGGGTLIAAIFAGIKYLKTIEADTLLKLEKVKATTAKLEITKQSKDQAETVKQQAQTIKERSQEVHDGRDREQTLVMQKAALTEQLKFFNQRIDELERRHQADKEDLYRRLNDCEEDRDKLWNVVHGISKPPTS
jgi:TolA-binding protein